MGLITPTLPTLGDPFSTEAADVGNTLAEIVSEINGGLDGANIADGSLGPTELLGFGAVVTVLPVAPVDGQICFLLASDGSGVVWQLRYRAASASTYKWEFVGGPPLYSKQTAAHGGFNTANVATNATILNWPAITAARAGEYLIEYDGDVQASSTGTASWEFHVGAVIGGVWGSLRKIASRGSNGDQALGFHRSDTRTLTAGQTITMSAATGGQALNVCQVGLGVMRVTPVRLS